MKNELVIVENQRFHYLSLVILEKSKNETSTHAWSAILRQFNYMKHKLIYLVQTDCLSYRCNVKINESC